MLGTMSLAVPAQADTGPPGQRSTLTTVSVKTLEKLHGQPAKNVKAAQSGAASEPAFFKTRKGAIAVGLMAAGAAFTFWSINHDRKPVKSPIR